MNLGEQYNRFATGRMSTDEEEQFRKEQNQVVGPPWNEKESFTGRTKWVWKEPIEPIKPKPAAIILKMWAEQLDNPDPEVERIATRLHDLADSLMENLK